MLILVHSPELGKLYRAFDRLVLCGRYVLETNAVEDVELFGDLIAEFDYAMLEYGQSEGWSLLVFESLLLASTTAAMAAVAGNAREEFDVFAATFPAREKQWL